MFEIDLFLEIRDGKDKIFPWWQTSSRCYVMMMKAAVREET